MGGTHVTHQAKHSMGRNLAGLNRSAGCWAAVCLVLDSTRRRHPARPGKRSKSPTWAYRAPMHLTFVFWSSHLLPSSTSVWCYPQQLPRFRTSSGHRCRPFSADLETGEIQRVPVRGFSGILFSLPGSFESRSRCQPLA